MDRTDHRADWNGGIFSFGSYGRNAEADGYFRSDRAWSCNSSRWRNDADVFLGQIPGAFTKPVYVEAAVVSAVIPFVLLYVNKKLLHSRYQIVYTKIIFLMDSLGLGIFTAMGVSTGVGAGYEKNMFFLCFLGTLTGVGGGLLRDMMAWVPPYIFVKHVYACASIAGAVCSVLVYRRYGQIPSLITVTAVTLLIRLAAAHYRWNLPCVKLEEGRSSINEPGTDKAEKDMPMINK